VPNGRPWTKEEIALLAEAIERDEGIEHVAARLGRTSLAVQAKASRLSLFSKSTDRA
jgi:hypothetical protein